MAKGRNAKALKTAKKGSKEPPAKPLHTHEFFTKGTKVRWLEKGALHPVAKQGECQSCIGHCVCGVVAAVHFLEYQDEEELLEFATQEMVDCATNNSAKPDKRGCRESSFKEAYGYIKEYGISLAKEYGKYKEKKEDCLRHRLKGKRLQIAGYKEIPPGGDVIPFLSKHPLSAAVVVTPKFKGLVKETAVEGIYEPPADKKYVFRTLEEAKAKEVDLHAVIIVDWGVDESGKRFYIIQNSWGVDWGYYGFARVSIDSVHFVGYPYGTKFVGR